MENQNPRPLTVIPDPKVIPGLTRDPENNSETPKPGGKFKLSAKAIISTIIFLLLAGGAAAGYVYREPIMSLVSKPTPTPTTVISPTPTPDPTADWKTYTSYELSFKYPSTMEVFPCGMKGVDQIVSVGLKKINDKTTYCGIGGLPAIYTISTYGERKTIEDYLTQLPLGTNQTISSIQYKEIGGLKLGFTILSTEGGFSTKTHAVINPMSNKLYYISSDKDWEDNEILLDQILSTFKFTDSNSSKPLYEILPESAYFTKDFTTVSYDGDKIGYDTTADARLKKTMINLGNTNLKKIKCTALYLNKGKGEYIKESAHYDFPPAQELYTRLAKLQPASTSSMQYCITEKNDEYVLGEFDLEQKTAKPGLKLLKLNPDGSYNVIIEDTSYIPGGYNHCQSLLAITNTNFVYIYCRGGSMTVSEEIIKFSTVDSSKDIVASCTVDHSEQAAPTICK